MHVFVPSIVCVCISVCLCGQQQHERPNESLIKLSSTTLYILFSMTLVFFGFKLSHQAGVDQFSLVYRVSTAQVMVVVCSLSSCINNALNCLIIVFNCLKNTAEIPA